MSMLWRKVVGDARQNGWQVALVALVLALGTAGVVAALDAQSILKREIAASYLAANAPDISLWFDKVDPQSMAEVAAHEGVAGVEARRVVFTRVAVRDGSWLPMRLAIVADIEGRAVGKLHRHDTHASPTATGLWIEQSGAALVADVGTALSVRTPTGGIATLPLAGYVHDASVAPSTQDRMIYAYATADAAALLGQAAEPDQLWVKMKARSDASDAARLGEALRDGLKARGRAPLRVDVLPNAHPHALLMNAMLRVLGVMSAIAFICSASLAGYLVSIWMRREVRLVGVMKAIGARRHQIALHYLLLVGPLVLGVAALAMPVGGAVGLALVRHYVDVLNIDVASWNVAGSLRLQEAGFTLAIALLAMAWPIVRASRMSVREAIHDAGIASPLTAGSRLAKAVTVPGGMRWTFALRNALRRPLRLALVLAALTAGGALLLTTRSNYDSLMSAIDASLAAQGHDIEIVTPRASPAAVLEAAARGVPGIAIAEAWRRAAVGVASNPTRRITLSGYPPASRLFKLPVVEGRLPSPDAIDEVLMTRSLSVAYPRLEPGALVPLQYRDRTVKVRVVGVVEEIGSPALYAPFPTFEAVTALGDAATALRAKAGGEALETAARTLDRAMLDAHLPPGQLLTRTMLRDALDEHFKVVGDVLEMVALAAALLGAIVLGAGSAFNVLERTREIGVLRALGAPLRSVAAMLLAEGAAIAGLGALASIALSIALTLALNGAAARSLLNVAVPLRFSPVGLALLGAGALVVILAVWLTLALALRRTVRDALSFEG